MKGLDHKTVLITGALGGIARATILALDDYAVHFIYDIGHTAEAFRAA